MASFRLILKSIKQFMFCDNHLAPCVKLHVTYKVLMSSSAHYGMDTDNNAASLVVLISYRIKEDHEMRHELSDFMELS